MSPDTPFHDLYPTRPTDPLSRTPGTHGSIRRFEGRPSESLDDLVRYVCPSPVLSQSKRKRSSRPLPKLKPYISYFFQLLFGQRLEGTVSSVSTYAYLSSFSGLFGNPHLLGNQKS